MKVGVFWIYKASIFGKTTELHQGEMAVSAIVDSPDNHADFWIHDREHLRQFPELSEREYFEVPRGRVLFDKTQNRSIVYLDIAILSVHVKELVCRFFDLEVANVLWRDDLHYKTSPADLDLLFND